MFLLPTLASLWFSLTRRDLFHATYIGPENFRQFFSEPFLVAPVGNTLICAVLTSALKTVLGLLLAVLRVSPIIGRGMLRTVVFFPVLVSISQDCYEASRIDGATRFQQFWRITLPPVWPATVTVVTLSLISGLRFFGLIWA